MKQINYYFDRSSDLKPFSHSLAANPDTLPPVNATRTEPEFEDGFWPCWNGESWSQAEDHRAQDVFEKESGAKVEIKALGPLPDNLTLIPRPGPAYRWGGEGWFYDLSLDSPGADFDWDPAASRWIKKRFSKKDFLLLCGLSQVTALNAAINAGNPLAKTVHDLLFASDYIDVTDPATVQLLQLLTTAEAGAVLTAGQAAEILKGTPHDSNS